MSGRWESNPRPEHGFRDYRLLVLWSKVANQFDRLDSNQAVSGVSRKMKLVLKRRFSVLSLGRHIATMA
jgi:hypothetical protein